PYDLTKVVNYEPSYMLGWSSDVYQKDVKQGFEEAEKIMDKHIRGEIIRQIPGDTYRNLNVRTRKHNITFKHLLLLMYVAAYTCNSRNLQVLVDDQTGTIRGQQPICWWKVALAVVVLAAVATAIYRLAK